MLCRIARHSKRCFPMKAVSGWLRRGDRSRIGLDEDYPRQAGEWRDIHGLDRGPDHPFAAPLYAVIARSGAREAN